MGSSTSDGLQEPSSELSVPLQHELEKRGVGRGRGAAGCATPAVSLPRARAAPRAVPEPPLFSARSSSAPPLTSSRCTCVWDLPLRSYFKPASFSESRD